MREPQNVFISPGFIRSVQQECGSLVSKSARSHQGAMVNIKPQRVAMPNKDYSEPDPELIERVGSATDEELSRYLENAKRKLPDTRWLVDVIGKEQLKRGGLHNLTAESARQIILKHAREGRTCTYKMIAEALSVSWSQAHWRLPAILGQVSEMENGVGRPLLTAIVTSQKGVCGDGFFQLARRNGHKFSDQVEFQQQEQQRVFDYWKDR